MKKILPCTIALALTFGLTACSTTETKSDEAACKEIESSLPAMYDEMQGKQPGSIDEALTMLKPLGDIASKAKDKASSEELQSSLQKVADTLQNVTAADLLEIQNLTGAVESIEKQCKAAGVEFKRPTNE